MSNDNTDRFTDRSKRPIRPIHGEVVDIGELRISRGRAKEPLSKCRHINQSYSLEERAVWCHDCESRLDPFDAYLTWVNHATQLKVLRDEYRAVREEKIISIAAQQLDRLFRSKKRMPLCPHCKQGLLSSDFEFIREGNREMEILRRKKK